MQNPVYITLGPTFRQYNAHWVQLPVESNDTSSTIIHEFGHALGITSYAAIESDFYLLSDFDRHLEDAYGTKLASLESFAQIRHVTSQAEAEAYHGQGYFVADDSNIGDFGIWFKGDHVTEVMTIDGQTADYAEADPYNPSNPLAIKNGMLRIEAYELYESGENIADFSHIELRNALMNHQSYRNFTSFMEAELAVLQDLGYSLDRRNFYGFSIYNNALTYTNNHPFYARNRAGNAYIYGMPNTTPLGVGLHVYGSGNTIYQNADLLADGVAGTGIRVDGSENSLIINAGTLVTANGSYGNALLVSYGRNNNLYHYGTLEAIGKEGIAARFDFGQSMLNKADDNRGSYIQTGFYAPLTCQMKSTVPLSMTL